MANENNKIKLLHLSALLHTKKRLKKRRIYDIL